MQLVCLAPWWKVSRVNIQFTFWSFILTPAVSSDPSSVCSSRWWLMLVFKLSTTDWYYFMCYKMSCLWLGVSLLKIEFESFQTVSNMMCITYNRMSLPHTTTHQKPFTVKDLQPRITKSCTGQVIVICFHGGRIVLAVSVYILALWGCKSFKTEISGIIRIQMCGLSSCIVIIQLLN